MEIRSAYQKIDPVNLDGFEKTRTQQNFIEECDINNVMKKYRNSQVVTHVNEKEPKFVDVSNLPVDLKTALDVVMAANQTFMEMPSEVRKRFENDPQQFVAFCENPANTEEMLKLGLLEPKPAAPVEPPPVKSEPATSGEPEPGKATLEDK